MMENTSIHNSHRWRYMVHSELETVCWFCGQDAIIKLQDKDKWICKFCEQQNGFDDVGIYISIYNVCKLFSINKIYIRSLISIFVYFYTITIISQ